jgi:hypothetical protein
MYNRHIILIKTEFISHDEDFSDDDIFFTPTTTSYYVWPGLWMHLAYEWSILSEVKK